MRSPAEREPAWRRLFRAQRYATRGPYVWRWTAAKRVAAKLVAQGYSQRSTARMTGANRLSIARWLRRREFSELVMRFQVEHAIATGALRSMNEAAAAVERAALAALERFEVDGPLGSAELVKLLAAFRGASKAERIAIGRVRLGRT